MLDFHYSFFVIGRRETFTTDSHSTLQYVLGKEKDGFAGRGEGQPRMEREKKKIKRKNRIKLKT